MRDLKWRQIRNIISKEGALRKETKSYPSGEVSIYIFGCVICGKEVEVRLQHIPYSTGRCKKHSQMHRPYEAVFGGILRSARERKLRCVLTYDEYLEYVGSKCHYCAGIIPWEPYNEHGKNNPGYYLDRKDSKVGYQKDNCVPCCTVCNMAKRGMVYQDFIHMCRKVAINHGS